MKLKTINTKNEYLHEMKEIATLGEYLKRKNSKIIKLKFIERAYRLMDIGYEHFRKKGAVHGKSI